MPKVSMGKTTTLSFRTEAALAEETTLFAKSAQQNRSDYIEQAVREKNERALAERIAFLSIKLSPQSLSVCEEMDDATGDGLA